MTKRIVLLLALLLASLAPAAAGSMTWKIRAFDKNVVDVKFFSQNRNVHWPPNNQVWSLKNYNVHTMKLACVDGEKICYGAWVRNNDRKQWGVGRHNRNKCSNCCYTCGPNTVSNIMNLNE